jgi:peptidoglycan/xylan/chitin deacetylase (PgdA/CDA1 family)
MEQPYKLLAKLVLAAFPEVTWKRSSNRKDIYLTFDDGPDPEITPLILDILKQYKVAALFFLQGEKLRQYSGKLKKINYHGHRLGNHGFHHMPLILRSSETLKYEILETDRLIERNFGMHPIMFRPPYGIWGPALRNQLNSMKKEMVLWSLMSNDFKWEAERVLTFLKKKVSGGDIIVFHDTLASRNTILPLLPDFLEFCQRNGFNFQQL